MVSLLKDAVVRNREERVDLEISDGVFVGVGPAPTTPGGEVVDLDGRLVLPELVEAHCHLDKTLYGGPWVPHPAGDALIERIQAERRLRSSLGVPDVDRITELLETMVAAGTTYVRTHTDIAPELGLSGVEAVDAATARLAGRIDVEQVAFPQYGILREPGTRELMAEALQHGVQVVGGIDPARTDGDPVRHLDEVFGLAERYGRKVDIHLHDSGSLGTWQLEAICTRTAALGLQGRVAVSHCYALGQADPAAQQRLASRLAEAG